jgi:hypothetical protein
MGAKARQSGAMCTAGVDAPSRAASISVAAASAHIGIMPAELTAIEITGDISPLTDEQMRRAAELYDVTIEYLQR